MDISPRVLPSTSDRGTRGAFSWREKKNERWNISRKCINALPVPSGHRGYGINRDGMQNGGRKAVSDTRHTSVFTTRLDVPFINCIR